MELRRINESDKLIILEWRNDPRVYKYALNPHPVRLEDHENWFAKVLKNEKCFFYMGLVDGKKIGTVRYDIGELENEAEVSISIAPDFWGQGYAFELMEKGEVLLKKESMVKVINATVLNENTASMKLFTKSLFQPVLTKFKKEI